MAFEHGMEQLERAVTRLQAADGSARQRLLAASAEIDGLGESGAIPAGILTEVADFRRRLASRDAVARLTDAQCRQEAERIVGWAEQLRAVMEDGAIGDRGPTELEHSERSRPAV